MMIDPYLAVALQTKVKHVKTRDEVQINLDHIVASYRFLSRISFTFCFFADMLAVWQAGRAR